MTDASLLPVGPRFELRQRLECDARQPDRRHGCFAAYWKARMSACWAMSARHMASTDSR